MALQLRLASQWIFQTDSAGEWDVYFYSTDAAKQVEKYASGEVPNAIEAVRTLIGVMCKKHIEENDENINAAEAPKPEELAAFTEEDLNEFARQFLERDSYISRENELSKSEDQSDAEFMLKVLLDENKKQSAKMREMFSSLNTSLSDLLGSKNSGIRSVSEDLMKQNEGLKNYFTPFPPQQNAPVTSYSPRTLPPNPIHETNVRLEEVTERLGNLVEFGENALKIMNRLQVASAEFLENFSNEAEKNSKSARKAIFVGFAAVTISIAQIIYTEFWRVPQDTIAMDAALADVRSDIGKLQISLVEKLGAIQDAQDDELTVVADAVTATGRTNKALLESIEKLLQLQRERDQAILSALAPKVTSEKVPAK